MKQSVFHLASPYEWNLKDVIHRYNSLSENNIELINFSGFIKQLKAQFEQGKPIPVPYFIRSCFIMSDHELNQVTFERGTSKICSKLTRECLEKIGVHVPIIDDRLIVKYFN